MTIKRKKLFQYQDNNIFGDTFLQETYRSKELEEV